jgi:hypothetical protein
MYTKKPESAALLSTGRSEADAFVDQGGREYVQVGSDGSGKEQPSRLICIEACLTRSHKCEDGCGDENDTVKQQRKI